MCQDSQSPCRRTSGGSALRGCSQPATCTPRPLTTYCRSARVHCSGIVVIPLACSSLCWQLCAAPPRLRGAVARGDGRRPEGGHDLATIHVERRLFVAAHEVDIRLV